MGTFFTVGAVEDPPALLLAARADLDLRTVARAEEELYAVTRRGGPPAVLVDMTGRFVGAQGMQVLVDAVVRARDGGSSCAVVGLPPDLLCRLPLFDADRLPFFGSLAEAAAHQARGRDVQAGG